LLSTLAIIGKFNNLYQNCFKGKVMSEEHGNLIKSPKQLILMVIAAFFIPLVVILLLLTYANSQNKPSAAEDQEIANRLIKPVANLDFKDASAPKVLKTGEEVYKNVCASCHTTGAAGAPVMGQSAAWASRISKGYPTLLTHALKGYNAMPARGGSSPDDVSDFEIGRAIVYIANNSGGKLPEPSEASADKEPTSKTNAK
jgi:cytochrome c5